MSVGIVRLILHVQTTIMFGFLKKKQVKYFTSLNDHFWNKTQSGLATGFSRPTAAQTTSFLPSF